VQSPLLRLPAELRNAIWELAYSDRRIEVSLRNTGKRSGKRSGKHIRLFLYFEGSAPGLVCKQHRAEVFPIFMQTCTFSFNDDSALGKFLTTGSSVLAQVRRIAIRLDLIRIFDSRYGHYIDISDAKDWACALRDVSHLSDKLESLEGQKELFNQGDDEEDAKSDDDSEEDSEMGSDVEMVDSDVELLNDGAEASNDDSSDSDSSDSSSDSDSDSEDEGDDAELTQFNNLLQMTLGTAKADMDADSDSDGSDMDDDAMMALDPQLSKIFQQRSQITSKKKDREDAKQNVVQFKSRVLDLLASYLEKQYSNPLTLELLLPILRRTRGCTDLSEVCRFKTSRLGRSWVVRDRQVLSAIQAQRGAHLVRSHRIQRW
jgi:hypothetical protein